MFIEHRILKTKLLISNLCVNSAYVHGFHPYPTMRKIILSLALYNSMTSVFYSVCYLLELFAYIAYIANLICNFNMLYETAIGWVFFTPIKSAPLLLSTDL